MRNSYGSLDVCLTDILEKVKAKHGGIDILCNNAGVYITTDEDLEKSSKTLRINLVTTKSNPNCLLACPVYLLVFWVSDLMEWVFLWVCLPTLVLAYTCCLCILPTSHLFVCESNHLLLTVLNSEQMVGFKCRFLSYYAAQLPIMLESSQVIILYWTDIHILNVPKLCLKFKRNR